MSDTEPGVSTHAVCAATGVTGRQLDHWTTNGAITPSIARADGPGSRRRWSRLDQARIAAIAQVAADLTALGCDGIPLPLVTQLWHRLTSSYDTAICQRTITICVSRPHV